MKLLKKRIKKETENYSSFTLCDLKDYLDNWSKLINIMKKVEKADMVEDDDYIYFKIYYTGNLPVEDKNEIFVSISSLPFNDDISFLGVREYLENHEMCFVFRKKKGK